MRWLRPGPPFVRVATATSDAGRRDHANVASRCAHGWIPAVRVGAHDPVGLASEAGRSGDRTVRTIKLCASPTRRPTTLLGAIRRTSIELDREGRIRSTRPAAVGILARG